MADKTAYPAPDIVAVYLQRIGNVPLLEPRQEREQFTRLRELEHHVSAAYCQYARGVLREAHERDVLPVSSRIAQRFDVPWTVLTARQQRDLSHTVEGTMKEDSFYVAAAEIHDIYGEAVQPGQRSRDRRHLHVERPGKRIIPTTYGSNLDCRYNVTEANLRLVVSTARRFSYSGIPFIDLLEEGNIGLLKAVERFDPGRGNRFSTYAIWWIRQAIKRSTEEDGLTVRVPSHMHEAKRYLYRGYRLAHQLQGRGDISAEDAVAAFNKHGGLKAKLTINQAMTVLSSVHDPKTAFLSLDASISEEDDAPLEEFFQSDPALDQRTPAVDPEQAAMDSSIAVLLREGMRYLSPMERDIVSRRFGMDGEEESILDDLGRKYNRTRERIRQIQAKGLKKMKIFLRKKGITGI